MTHSVNGHQPDTNPAGWTPLSPEQIRHQQFSETGFARRGYKAEEVDLFLAKLAREVDQWSTSYAQMWAEVNRLRNWYRENDVDIDAAQRRQVSVEAANVLVEAQRQADQVIADAHAQARHVQSDARTHAEAIVAQARQDAESAAHAYRARSGSSYMPEREELERWAAWGRSLLAAITAAKAQLEATGEAFAFELAKISPPSEPVSGAASSGNPLAGGGAWTGNGVPYTGGSPAVARAVVYEQIERPWQ